LKTRLLVAATIALVAGALAPSVASARTLYQGTCGKGVWRLQTMLADRSYLPAGYHTACVTYRTSQAIMAFQGWVKFPRTGYATDLDQRRLELSGPPRQWATWKFRHIEIHKRRQIMLLIGGRGIVQRTIHVSTARPGYVTPNGRFKIYAKYRMSWSRPFGVWLPWASYVVGGIAIHSYPSVPGYPASHGCIRVPEPEAVFVYRWSPIGTPVWIR
jgi:L,D-transpeptidase catalytic domain